MPQLIPCPNCQRHLAATETVCPFCASALGAVSRVPEARSPQGIRLGRVAALTALSMAAFTACDPGVDSGTADMTGTGATTGSGGIIFVDGDNGDGSDLPCDAGGAGGVAGGGGADDGCEVSVPIYSAVPKPL